MDNLKICPYCGEEILESAIKCKYCGEVLNKESTNGSKRIEIPYEYLNTIKIIITVILILGIITCIIWVLGFDYPAAILNHENFWHGQYLIAGILHTLLAILFTIILTILK